MKYWPGDKVVVRDDLKIDEYYYMEDGRDCCFVPPMRRFLGREVTISDTFVGRYVIDEDHHMCVWADEMFEDCPVGNAVFPSEDPSLLYGWS